LIEDLVWLCVTLQSCFYLAKSLGSLVADLLQLCTKVTALHWQAGSCDTTAGQWARGSKHKRGGAWHCLQSAGWQERRSAAVAVVVVVAAAAPVVVAAAVVVVAAAAVVVAAAHVAHVAHTRREVSVQRARLLDAQKMLVQGKCHRPRSQKRSQGQTAEG